MQTDFLDDLLTSNPNEGATKGLVLLLRTEMKSEFKALRADFQALGSEFQTLKAQVTRVEKSLDLVATQVALILQKLS